VRDVAANELQRGDLPDVLSPSLFGERRVLVVRSAQDLAKDVAAELTAYLADPLEDVHVVVAHAGGAKGKALLTALLAAKPRRVDAPKLTKPAERRDFVRRELKADGRIVEEEAVAALFEAVGSDLRELASAAGQLLADHDGPITTEVVGRYHRGRAESSGFTVADRPWTVTSAARSSWLAGARARPRTGARDERPRQHAARHGAGRQRRPVPAHQLAGQLGMPPWKVEKTQRQARGWRPEGLSDALLAVARADADVKGAAADQGVRRRAGALRGRAGPLGRPVTPAVEGRGRGRVTAAPPRPRPAAAVAAPALAPGSGRCSGRARSSSRSCSCWPTSRRRGRWRSCRCSPPCSSRRTTSWPAPAAPKTPTAPVREDRRCRGVQEQD
jgi:DNA polymerase-3 subunit delta